MKTTVIAAAAALFAFGAQAAESFTIHGLIPGLKAGTNLTIAMHDVYGRDDIATGKADDGSFVLRGTVAQPSLAEIRIEASSPEMQVSEYAFPLLLENTTYNISAECVDSLPPSFYFGSHGRELEARVKIEGGELQRQYQEYKDATYASDIKTRNAHYARYIDANRPKDKESEKALEKAHGVARMELDACTDSFAAAHPDYSISGSIFADKLHTPFAYTREELDALEAAVAPMKDAARLATVNKAIAKARTAMRGCDYFDFATPDADGALRRLSEFVGKNYVLVDFWASWCGPCRAAIPHVKSLAEKYGDKLTVISCSLDSNEEAWRGAMQQEAMPWTQLWADAEHLEKVTEPYQFRAIPFLIVISPEGKIVHSGHDADALTAFLEKNIR